MEINVLEDKKHRLLFEIKGEGHGFCNILKAQVGKNPDVKLCSYKIEHPLIGTPTMIIETTKEDPREVLLDACNKIKKENDKFIKLFDKEIK